MSGNTHVTNCKCDKCTTTDIGFSELEEYIMFLEFEKKEKELIDKAKLKKKKK